ncbi:MAG: TylF/MycF family methyltransferase [Candidatus Adiutrix sp.]|jgi:hypothetical protein|nr:TylF/MycF family methyltransferase [Candidatus Adiutrix sp.]
METFSPENEKKSYHAENAFYLTCEQRRIKKILAQYELYKMTLGLPGQIVECGVYKGCSLIRICAFRDALGASESRKVIAFDAFGDFPIPSGVNSNDRDFANKFNAGAGPGLEKNELENILAAKRVTNFELVKGDILETLPAYLKDHPELRIAFLHIDVDLCQVTGSVLANLFDLVVRGGVIMLDDYALVDGATRAVDDFFRAHRGCVKKLELAHVPCFVVKE